MWKMDGSMKNGIMLYVSSCHKLFMSSSWLLDKVHTINMSHLLIEESDKVVVITVHGVGSNVSLQFLYMAFLLVLIHGFCN